MEEKTLTDEQLKTLKSKALEVLSHTRHMLLIQYPFIGSIALQMNLVPTRDVRVRTACTDGNTVYFDIAFLSSLSSAEQQFVLAHEIWHAVLLHLTRRGTRDPMLFNIATDKEVNYLLKQDGNIPPDGLCFPEDDETGKCAEEIYEMLLKKNKKPQLKNHSGSSSSSKSQGNSGKNKKDANSELNGQFDKHIYDKDEFGQQDANGQPNNNELPKVVDKYGEVGIDPDFQPSIPKDFANKMRETVISTAQRVEKMKKYQGNFPAHIKELVNKFMTPEIKWQELLAQFVTRCYSSGSRSWIPPNRRHIHNDIYLQSRQNAKLKACVAIDTSGSTYNDRTKFLSELTSLINSFGNYELTIICADAKVDDVKTYTQDDNLNIEMDGYEMHGGGGTSFIPPFDYIIDNKIDCDVFLYLTDGYGPAPEKNPLGIPVMWIITKDGTEDFCDWGQKIRLKTNDADCK